MLMLMVHSEAGAKYVDVSEYILGAKKDGLVKHDGNFVMHVIIAQ